MKSEQTQDRHTLFANGVEATLIALYYYNEIGVQSCNSLLLVINQTTTCFDQYIACLTGTFQKPKLFFP